MQSKDVALIVGYWMSSDAVHLQRMGVDLHKMPPREAMEAMLQGQLSLPLEKRRAYALIWECDGKPVGHCNTNPTSFGLEAYMHLHLWQADTRQQGMGAELVQRSLPFFFEKLRLQRLYSEPYALNEAPNRTLMKVGFRLEKEYVTVPGSLNFEQPVKRWLMSRERYAQLFRAS